MFMSKSATLAKKSGSSEAVNKAQLIRDALKKLGIDASAKDIQTECEVHNVTVAPAQISNIRTKLKEKGSSKAGRKAGSGSGMAATADELIEVRTMAEKIGGVQRAKALLDILDRLR
jgi:ferritin-like metal-binding protein YciE